MSNFHRILWIDSQLRGERYPNATRIAEQFEISRRQAARDIEYMRYSLGAPLEFCAAENGYRYTDDAFALPAMYLTGPERAALNAVARGDVAAAGSTGQLVSRFLSRATALRPPDQMRRAVPAGVQPNAAETRALLQRALESRRVVIVTGNTPAGRFRILRLHPYRFEVERGHVAYLVGFCPHTDMVEAWHLAFIDEVRLTEQRFREERVQRAVAPGARRAYEAELEVHRGQLPQGLAAQAQWIEDGRCRVPFESSDALLGALLGEDTAFRVLRPRWLRRLLVARLARLLEQNSPRASGGTSYVPPAPPLSEGGRREVSGRDPA